MTSPVLPDGQCHCDKSYYFFVVHRNFSFFFLQLESIRSVHSSAKYAFHKFLANLFFFGIYPLGLSYKYNSLFNTNATCEPISVWYLLVVVLGTFLSPSEYWVLSNCFRLKPFISSVRSSNSHPDLLVTHPTHPLFQITPVLKTGLSLSEPLQLYKGYNAI